MIKPDYISKPDWEILTAKYHDNMSYLKNKLNKKYPYQYLIGNVEFLNTIIDVDERVLIPRFETEVLVDKVISLAKSRFSEQINIIDLGTGSGCIIIALTKNLNSHSEAIDINNESLQLASANALKNKVFIDFSQGDMTDALTKTYDIIISNPPYIPFDGYVEESVKKYEPNIALYAKEEGLYYYKKIITNNISKLSEKGFMAFEVGDNLYNLLKEFLDSQNLKYQFINDYQKIPRYLFIFSE